MKPYKFLLVEDEPIISMHIEETLNNLGYNNIQKSFDAPTALQNLSNEKFDMVLMDINLGGGNDGKDGIDIITEIKKHVNVPVIYITGNSDYKTVHKAKFSYPDGFIVKPFSETDLKITLELVLHKAESKLKKKERVNSKHEFSYEENLKNLVIRLGPNGEIFYVNSYIKKITDKPPVYYNDKKIEDSDFDPFFASTLTNILNEVKSANRHLFYCNLKNKNEGERVMEIIVTPDSLSNNTFGSYLLRFNDVTNRMDNPMTKQQRSLQNSVQKKNTISKKLAESISRREKEVLICVKEGMSNKVIAAILKISPKTVSIHRGNLMEKLKAQNAVELIRIAIENNLISSRQAPTYIKLLNDLPDNNDTSDDDK